MKVSFPAMRGQIGQRTYYSCLMPLSVIPKMFTFRDWIEFRPEDREQRILNQKRVPLIGKYIIDNEDGYIFSSITASYKCDVKFAAHDDSDIGTLEMEFEDVPTGTVIGATEFRKLEGWSSMMALIIIAKIDSDYNVTVTAEELTSCNTINNLFELVYSKAA